MAYADPMTANLAPTLAGWLTDHASEMHAFAAALVRIRSENPPGNAYEECRRCIVEELLRVKCEPTVIELRPADGAAGDAIQAFHGASGPTVYFHGHYDVVPAFSPDQFNAQIAGNRLFGRGSADMKGGLALMLYAMRAIKECGIPLRGRVGLTFVPDEETGGARGSRLLAEQGILGRDGIAMFTPEPTSGVIWSAARGALSLRISITGRSAHVGEHYQGASAFEAMLRICDRLRRLRELVETRRTRFAITPEEARQSVLLLGGTVRGGTNFNTVPDSCVFTVDRRINPEESLEQEERALLDAIFAEPIAGITVSVETLQRAASSASENTARPAQALAVQAEAVLGDAPPMQLCPGLLETRFYSELGIPAFAYGPGSLSVAHGPTESVDLDLARQFALVYALTACELLQP